MAGQITQLTATHQVKLSTNDFAILGVLRVDSSELECVLLRYSLRPRGAAVTFFVAVLSFLVLFALLRTMLLWRMGDLHHTREPWELVRAFSVGARFDLLMAIYACMPLIFSELIRGTWYSRFCLAWLTTFGSLYLFLGLVELEFYAEFQQRLNSLVFVYIREDFETVVRMIWEGLPVVTYLSGWSVLLFLSYRIFRLLIERFMWEATAHRQARHVGTTIVLFLVAVLCARGRCVRARRFGGGMRSPVTTCSSTIFP